jgi:succinoglycan biosynthesis transport protein ExoP
VESWRGTDESPQYPDLARILATARRWWWALLLGALVTGALALAANPSGTVTYQASTRLLVGPIGGDYSLLRAAGQQAQTYADLATSQPVLAATRARLGSADTAGALRRRVTAQADDVSRLLTISARAKSPAVAAATANALATELQRVTRATVPESVNELRVVEPAQAPRGPVAGHSRLLVALAALAGLLGVLTVLVIYDLARGRVTTEEELAAASSAPVLGTVGRDPDALLRAVDVLGGERRHVVVAGVDSDGSAMRAADALAAALAVRGARVLLVDADPATGALARRLRLEERLRVAGTRSRGMRRHGVALDVTRIAVTADESGRLNADTADRLEALGGLADVVIIIAPAATGFPGAAGWAHRAGGTILAVRSGHGTRDRVAAAVELLEQADAVVLGAVVVRRSGRRRALRLSRPRPLGRAAPATPAGKAGPA